MQAYGGLGGCCSYNKGVRLGGNGIGHRGVMSQDAWKSWVSYLQAPPPYSSARNLRGLSSEELRKVLAVPCRCIAGRGRAVGSGGRHGRMSNTVIVPGPMSCGSDMSENLGSKLKR
jgi:hypothetical protein